jgi:hypothetical protein
MKNNSTRIILEKFKKDLITEEEALILIEDIYSNNSYYYPYWTYRTFNTGTEENPLKYEVTCTHENNKMS